MPEEVIARCVAFKAGVVERDEKEQNERRLLNLGHTIGHAIEKCSAFTIPHGMGVGGRLDIMGGAGGRLGGTEAGTDSRICACLEKNDLPVTSGYPAGALAAAAASDKKRAGDDITIVVPEAIGRCVLKKLPVGELLSIITAGLEA